METRKISNSYLFIPCDNKNLNTNRLVMNGGYICESETFIRKSWLFLSKPELLGWTISKDGKMWVFNTKLWGVDANVHEKDVKIHEEIEKLKQTQEFVKINVFGTECRYSPISKESIFVKKDMSAEILLKNLKTLKIKQENWVLEKWRQEFYNQLINDPKYGPIALAEQF